MTTATQSQPSTSSELHVHGISDEDRYLFDLQGFLVVKNALAQDELTALNQLVDQQNLPEPGETVTAKNTGGRHHTFTEVTNFGGGFVSQLNGTLKTAPECAAVAANPPLAPGASVDVKGLSVGNHSFQCCIHPWMRILIKVEHEEKDKD